VYVYDYSVVINFLSIHVIGLGNVSVVEKLIAARCNVNIQEMDGLTLHRGQTRVSWHHGAADCSGL
jgi:hypothetical protein